MRPAGPLVPAVFGDTVARRERQRIRAELGLAPQDLAVLLSSGSLGLGDVEATAAAVRDAGGVPVVLCGRNLRLQRRVASRGHRALGWRGDVAALMAAVDVLVHNAGGLSLTEALDAGLPAVTYAPIAGHGRANAALLDSSGLVPWARSTTELAACLRAAADQPRTALPPVDQPAARFVADLATRQAGRTGSAGPAARRRHAAG